MKTIKTENFEIEYSEGLENYASLALEKAESKKQQFCELFNCSSEDIGILKASFFNVREDFINHIKNISGGSEPPVWAEGCFYNGEIQAMVRPEVEEERINTLAHETVHLFFTKTVYEKYNIDRVRWLDESFAVYLDGEPDDIPQDELWGLVCTLKPIANGFDMNILNDVNKVCTSEYNGYDMFNVIGKYIFETHQEKEFLTMLKTNRNKIEEIGTHILLDAINYFEKNIEMY